MNLSENILVFLVVIAFWLAVITEIVCSVFFETPISFGLRGVGYFWVLWFVAFVAILVFLLVFSDIFAHRCAKLILALLLLPTLTFSAGVGINRTGDMFDMWNSYRHYYINATNAIQYTNHPNEYWTWNYLCINSTVTGVRCADTIIGFTWTNSTDNLTYALLIGKKQFVFSGGRRLNVTLYYYLNSTEDRIRITPVLSGNFIFSGSLAWVTAKIKINNNQTDNWARLWLNNGTNEYQLHETANLTFTDADLSQRTFYLHEGTDSYWAQTWWDRAVNLSIFRNTTYNSILILQRDVLLSGNWEFNFTLWWVDAVCSWSTSMSSPASNQNLEYGTAYTQTGGWSGTGSCPVMRTCYADYQNRTGGWQHMTSTTNISTTDSNPQDIQNGDSYSWASQAGDAPEDIFDSYNVSVICDTSRSVTKKINVTDKTACEVVSSSTTLTSNKAVCLNITCSSCTLDCNGYTINLDYTKSYGQWGVYVAGKTGVTIKNCKINNSKTGIYLSQTNSSNIWNNTITNIFYQSSSSFTNYGIRIENSQVENIQNNTITNVSADCTGDYCGSLDYGIYLDNVHNSSVRNNSINYVDYDTAGAYEGALTATGLYISGNFNNATLNKFNNTEARDIDLASGMNNSIWQNTYNNSRSLIIVIQSANNLTLTDEQLTNNNSGVFGGIRFYNPCVGTNTIQNISIQNITKTSSSDCLDFINEVTNCYLSNFSIINCSNGIELQSSSSNNVFSNFVFGGQNTYDVKGSSSYNNTLFNSTGFTRSKTSFSNANLTLVWSARINVTNSTGSGLQAYVNVSRNNGVSEFSGLTGIDGNTSWFNTTDEVLGTGAVSFQNHSVNVSNSSYSLNQSSFNMSSAGTWNVTLYVVVANDYSFTITFPTGTSLIHFAPTNCNDTGVNATNQTNTQPIIVFTNTGNVAETYKINLTALNPPGIVLKGSPAFGGWQSSCSCQGLGTMTATTCCNITTEQSTVNGTATPVSGTQNLWLWADYNYVTYSACPSPQTYERTSSIQST